VVSSIRSRQTGQVGNSTSDGVGGACGFAVRDEASDGASTGEETPAAGGRGATGCFVGTGAKGSFVRSGYEVGSRFESPFWKFMDLTKTTWQYSGCSFLAIAMLCY
jgi:hypothetical protein